MHIIDLHLVMANPKKLKLIKSKIHKILTTDANLENITRFTLKGSETKEVETSCYWSKKTGITTNCHKHQNGEYCFDCRKDLCE